MRLARKVSPSLGRLHMATEPDALAQRVAELDTIVAVLPMERRDELAELLTDQDVETLRHLVNEGMGANTLRALTSDLAYLQAWSLAATDRSLPWPAPEALLLKFVAHHLWDPEKRITDPDHGMPHEVDHHRLRRAPRDGASGPNACSGGPDAEDLLRQNPTAMKSLLSWETSGLHQRF